MNLLGDAVVDANGGQILGNEPLLAVAFDDAALKWKVICGDFEALFTPNFFQISSNSMKTEDKKHKLVII